MSAVGLVVGGGAAVASRPLLQAVIGEITTFDLAAVGGGAIGIIAVTLIASYLPAARAARIAPVEALRSE